MQYGTSGICLHNFGHKMMQGERLQDRCGLDDNIKLDLMKQCTIVWNGFILFRLGNKL